VRVLSDRFLGGYFGSCGWSSYPFVVSPPIIASLPVAIDTGKLEAESFGQWSLFVGRRRTEELQRSIIKSLAAEANSPALLQLQREVARQTLNEFVAKWLITQERWKDSSSYQIRVFCADEPGHALGTLPQPFVGAL
jgi:hypothetical protein